VSDGDKLIINAAITGCVITKADNPHLPVTTQEIVACACRVQQAGASIVHLHARDAAQRPVCGAAVYNEIVAAVRRACPELIVCVSLTGRQGFDANQRAAALASQPDMATLTLGSLNFPTQASVNPPETVRDLARRIRLAGAVPELEVFEPGFANYAKYLIHKGELSPPHYFNIILGSLGSSPLDLVGLGHIISLLPEGAIWAVAGIGRYQLDANVIGIAAGGHVRVGLEDNPWFDRGRRELADNARLVDRIAAIGRAMGREPASAAETRRILGLSEANNSSAPLRRSA
jgi:3-keto-5-aminohexanoate cleavage enzyme